MSSVKIAPLLLVFKGLPTVTSDSQKFKSISHSEFLNDTEYSNAKRVWLLVKNMDTYDGTYLEMNIVPHSRFVKRMLDHLESKGYRLGKYDSVGEKRYQVIEGLIENKNPEYCEIHLEASKAEEVARSIVGLLSNEKGRIHLSTVK